MRASIPVSILIAGAWLVAVSGRAQIPGSPTQTPPQTAPQTPSVFRARTDLVVLHVAVLDRASQFVPGLEQRDFHVREDGLLQSISVFEREDTPATIGLVIDNSGSMRAKLADVTAAANAFARASNTANEVFITDFNEHVWSGLPAGLPFTSDLAVLTQGLAHIQAFGQTALYDALNRSLDQLQLGTRRRHVLVVISDGGDNASKARLEDVLKRARDSEVVIYAIGLYDESSDEPNPEVLKELAAVTGGEALFPDDTHQATQALERIARGIRSVYTIGYTPSNVTRDGRFRRVEVTLDPKQDKHLKVRARIGYLAPLGGPDCN